MITGSPVMQLEFVLGPIWVWLFINEARRNSPNRWFAVLGAVLLARWLSCGVQPS